MRLREVADRATAGVRLGNEQCGSLAEPTPVLRTGPEGSRERDPSETGDPPDPAAEERAGWRSDQKMRREPPRGSRITTFSNDMSDSNDEPLVTVPSSSVWTVAESLQIRSRSGS